MINLEHVPLLDSKRNRIFQGEVIFVVGAVHTYQTCTLDTNSCKLSVADRSQPAPCAKKHTLRHHLIGDTVCESVSPQWNTLARLTPKPSESLYHEGAYLDLSSA